MPGRSTRAGLGLGDAGGNGGRSGRAGPRTSSRKCSWEEDGKTCFWSKTALEEPAILILTDSPFASGTAGYKSPTFSEASWILFSLLGSSAVTPSSLHRLLS